MSERRTSDDELAREVAAWEEGRIPEGSWRDAPQAVPRVSETKAVSVRFPTVMLELLRGFARREGVGYQVLMKRWLDERLRQERDRLRGKLEENVVVLAPRFPLEDSPEGPHLRVVPQR